MNNVEYNLARFLIDDATLQAQYLLSGRVSLSYNMHGDIETLWQVAVASDAGMHGVYLDHEFQAVRRTAWNLFYSEELNDNEIESLALDLLKQAEKYRKNHKL